MKFFRFFFILILALGCKSNKTLVDTNSVSLKKLSARKIIKKHVENSFAAKTLDAKLRVLYRDNKLGKENKETLKARLRILKDSVIWIKGSKLISAFRAKITPSSFSYYSPITKEYFLGDYTFLKKLLGVEVTFKQVQNLFFGHSLLNLQNKKHESSLELKAYKLTPKQQEELFSIFFYFNPSNFRIKKQLLMDKENKTLTISYPDYLLKDDEFFPKKIEINTTDKNQYTFISIDVKSIEVNKPISTPYRIPDGYKELVVPTK